MWVAPAPYPSAAVLCSVACALALRVHDNAIVRRTSPTDSSVTGCHLRVKGRFGFKCVE